MKRQLKVAVWMLVAAPLVLAGRSSGRVEESATLPTYLQDYIVDEHNWLRGKVNPPAAKMKNIRWDSEVAQYATNWARCENWFQHRPNNNRIYGENLYVSYNYSLEDAVMAAIKGWWAEWEDFSYSRNKCARGKACGHYTQMAWADTYAIGCGYAKNCPGEMMDFYLVCSYKEPGNVIGQRPYSTN